MKYSKSVVCNRYGSYDCMQVCNHPLREVTKDDIVVSVHYCGMNFADLYTRQGLIRKHTFPFVLGMECTGIITEVGDNLQTSDFKVGKKVLCYDHMGGMYRETVVVGEKNCFLLPDDADLELSATIFVNYLTAHFCVVKLAALQPNENILIHSCAGGVGWAATQIAKRVPNVQIFGTASSSKRDAVKGNGVDFVLDYENFDQQFQMLDPSFSKGFDVILDNNSLNGTKSSHNYLKNLGRIVTIGANNLIQNHQKISNWSLLKAWWRNTPIPLLKLMHNSQSFSGFHLGILTLEESELVREVFRRLYDDVIKGVLKPKIDSIWSLDDVVTATKVLADRKNIGKVLLRTSNAILHAQTN